MITYHTYSGQMNRALLFFAAVLFIGFASDLYAQSVEEFTSRPFPDLGITEQEFWKDHDESMYRRLVMNKDVIDTLPYHPNSVVNLMKLDDVLLYYRGAGRIDLQASMLSPRLLFRNSMLLAIAKKFNFNPKLFRDIRNPGKYIEADQKQYMEWLDGFSRRILSEYTGRMSSHGLDLTSSHGVRDLPGVDLPDNSLCLKWKGKDGLYGLFHGNAWRYAMKKESYKTETAVVYAFIYGDEMKADVENAYCREDPSIRLTDEQKQDAAAFLSQIDGFESIYTVMGLAEPDGAAKSKVRKPTRKDPRPAIQDRSVKEKSNQQTTPDKSDTNPLPTILAALAALALVLTLVAVWRRRKG